MAQDDATSEAEHGGRTSDWARRYPPLLTMLVALVLAVVVLPSSLNLPQTNPTQTLEFAPVPPDDENDDPPQGNTAALGAGGSSTIGSGEEAGRGTDGGPGGGLDGDEGGRVDPDTQCVGKPPRQTFDPLSPPCVPFWDENDDNGGATYQGVTPNEVRLLVYLDGGIRYIEASNTGNQVAPSNTLYDLWDTEDECRSKSTNEGGCTHLSTQALRVWQTYFNKRFQTYGRDVHFFVYFAGGPTDTSRRQDAAEAYAKVKPFGVVSIAQGAEEAFLDGMARRGVLNFGSFAPRERAFFDEFPGQIWSYLPSAAALSEDYGTFVCQKVIGPNPGNPLPSVMADPSLNGRPRKLAMLHTTSKDWPGLRSMAATVRDHVIGCGGVIEDTITYSSCCLAREGGSVSPSAQQDMQRLRNRGVTTILWTGGVTADFTKAAASIGYFPEWIVLGDSVLDAHHPVRLSDSSPSFDGHAVVVSPQPFKPQLEQQRCYAAFREINTAYSNSDFQYTCDWYDDLFQFFVGVQVSGPYLGPTQIDKGFRAIPQHYVGRPDVPACFYPIGDYTCIKDAQVLYWNAQMVPPGDERPGCWRAIEYGRRYAPGAWPSGNIDGQIRGDEPCTTYDKRVQFSFT
ncbi:MAG: hypothetical protein ACT452_16800 [Microthrixaceae bacterium]